LTMTGGPKSSVPWPWGGSSSSFVAIFVINPQELLRYKPVEVPVYSRLPEEGWICFSQCCGPGSRRAKMTPKKQKKI
jgi:hypothetical protein